MSVFILSNRKIVSEDGKPSFSNEEYSVPNFRIAKCNFDQYKEPTLAEQKKKSYTGRKILDYRLLSEPEKQGYEQVLEVLKKEKKLIQSSLTKDHLGGTQRMFYELYKEMSTTKSRNDVLIFIHGYAYTFNDELKSICDLKKMYVDNPKSPINHILFISWPASSSVFPLTYFDDKAASINSGNSLLRLFYLYTQFLKDIFSTHEMNPCNQRVHMMAHSMGNRLLQSMLYSMKTSNIVRVIDQVILLSADVNYRVFDDDEDSFVKLPLLANRISIYINRKDNILNISQFTKNILAPRLGKIGPSNISQFKAVISVIDCTGAKNDLKNNLKFNIGNHWNYLASSLVQQDIVSVLEGKDQQLIAKRTKEGSNGFILS